MLRPPAFAGVLAMTSFFADKRADVAGATCEAGIRPYIPSLSILARTTSAFRRLEFIMIISSSTISRSVQMGLSFGTSDRLGHVRSLAPVGVPTRRGAKRISSSGSPVSHCGPLISAQAAQSKRHNINGPIKRHIEEHKETLSSRAKRGDPWCSKKPTRCLCG